MVGFEELLFRFPAVAQVLPRTDDPVFPINNQKRGGDRADRKMDCSSASKRGDGRTLSRNCRFSTAMPTVSFLQDNFDLEFQDYMNDKVMSQVKLNADRILRGSRNQGVIRPDACHGTTVSEEERQGQLTDIAEHPASSLPSQEEESSAIPINCPSISSPVLFR